MSSSVTVTAAQSNMRRSPVSGHRPRGVGYSVLDEWKDGRLIPGFWPPRALSREQCGARRGSARRRRLASISR
jgi:hypothetical protein